MELYVFLISVLVRLIAAMIVIFSCFSGKGLYLSYSSIGMKGKKILKREKKIKMYRSLTIEEAFELIKGIKSPKLAPNGENIDIANSLVEKENVII